MSIGNIPQNKKEFILLLSNKIKKIGFPIPIKLKTKLYGIIDFNSIT